MSSEIIINVQLRSTCFTFSYCLSFGLVFFLWDCSLQSCLCLTKRRERQRKFDIGKCVFNFLRCFFLLSLAACSTNFISIKHHFIHNLFSSRTQFPLWWKRRTQWNGTAWWKLDEEEQAQIFECSKRRWQPKKNWRIWNWSYIMLNRVTQTARHCELLKKTYFSINQMHHDPIWLDPQLRRKPNYNRIDIVLFLAGFLASPTRMANQCEYRRVFTPFINGKYSIKKKITSSKRSNVAFVLSKSLLFFDAVKSKIVHVFSFTATSSMGNGRLITWHRTRLHTSKLLLQFSVGRNSPGATMTLIKCWTIGK